jgi:hypothetical protein
MTTIIIDVEAVELGNVTKITAKHDDRILQTTIPSDELQNVNDLAEWVLAQQEGQDHIVDTTLQKRLTIDYHIDGSNQKIIDSVSSESLPSDEGHTNFLALVGWSTWTATEAETWIDSNVVDISSAKTAMKAMAKAIIYFRNIVID